MSWRAIWLEQSVKNGDLPQPLGRHFLQKDMPRRAFASPRSDHRNGALSNEVIDPARTLVLLVGPKVEIADG